MKKITLSLVAYLCLILTTAQAQETFEMRAKAIAEKIEKITQEEKSALKVEVEAISEQQENGAITKQQADDQKLAIAEKRAKNIEDRSAIAQTELRELVQDKVDGKIQSGTTKKYGKSIYLAFGDNGADTTNVVTRKTSRTASQFVFATGLNNVVTNNSLSPSDYKTWGSHFYEWGVTWNTRIAKENNLLHAKYGLSLMYNNLRPSADRIFVEDGDQTILQTSATNIKDSRFRNVYLVVPLHLEFDFSKNDASVTSDQFVTHNGFRVGLGGYAGGNIKSKQIVRYDANGHDFRVREKGDFNVNDFIYGVSAYVGYRGTSLYMKYDLNPIFKNNVVEQNNVSLGIRFDIN